MTIRSRPSEHGTRPRDCNSALRRRAPAGSGSAWMWATRSTSYTRERFSPRASRLSLRATEGRRPCTTCTQPSRTPHAWREAACPLCRGRRARLECRPVGGFEYSRVGRKRHLEREGKGRWAVLVEIRKPLLRLVNRWPVAGGDPPPRVVRTLKL